MWTRISEDSRIFFFSTRRCCILLLAFSGTWASKAQITLRRCRAKSERIVNWFVIWFQNISLVYSKHEWNHHVRVQCELFISLFSRGWAQRRQQRRLCSLRQQALSRDWSFCAALRSTYRLGACLSYRARVVGFLLSHAAEMAWIQGSCLKILALSYRCQAVFLLALGSSPGDEGWKCYFAWTKFWHR